LVWYIEKILRNILKDSQEKFIDIYLSFKSL
jgi:hypothetical protein